MIMKKAFNNDKKRENYYVIATDKTGIEYVDLSMPEVQGRFGHDKIDALTKPGFYKLPFRTYEPSGIQNIIVDVVSVFSIDDDDLDQNIVCYDGDFMWVFYYNGNEKCFKPNWENDSLNDVYHWIDINRENDELIENN